MKPRHLTVVTAALGALVTLLVSVLPTVNFAYQNLPLHVALETVAAFIALLAAYLVFGRFRESARLGDLALVCALVIFGSSGLAFSALPRAFSIDNPENFATWTSVVAVLLGAAALAFSAFAPERRVAQPARAAVVALLASGALQAVPAALFAVFAARLPDAIPGDLASDPAGGPSLASHPAVLACQFAVMAFFAAAAIGFIRRAEPSRDELMYWFSAGSTLAAFARLSYLLFPSLYSEWISVGDLLRLGFGLLLVVGAGREIGAYWRGLARAAVLEERRRMARDLHDGLAQELTFMTRELRRLGRDADEATAAQVVAAAERALDESRRAIAALTRPIDEPLGVALAQAAEEVAGRVGTRVRFDFPAGVDVSGARREALVRIVREAVTNAGRHGGASLVELQLANGRGVTLRIVDDGCGFETAADPPPRGFGLVSMRERARAVGGELRLASAPGRGTELEVTLP